MAGVYRGAFHAEIRSRHLALIQLARWQGRAVGGSPQVAGSEQGDQCRVYGISWPAVGRGSEVGAHFAAFASGAYVAQDLRAHGVLLGLAGEVDCFQRAFGTVAGAFDDGSPAAVVGVGKLGVEACHGCFGGGLHFLRQMYFQAFAAAALDHFGARDDLPRKHAQVVLRFRCAGLHAAAGLDALLGGRHALVFDGLGGGVAHGDQSRQFVGMGFRDEHMDHRIVLTGSASPGEHAVLGDPPAVLHPNRHAIFVGLRFIAQVQGQLARFLGVALQNLHWRERPLHGFAQPFRALGAHARGIVCEFVAAVAELDLPIAAFPGLQAVFVVDFQQRAGVH